jgi:uncharacterized protein (DUF488 family)
MKIFTIGFTKKSAEDFFTRLRNPEIQKLVDVRLNNVSQLAGFAKKDDLRFFAKVICGIEYIHLPQLAPTQVMLDSYKKMRGTWSKYEKDFLELIKQRQIELSVSRELLDGGCLLCSEDKPDHCHRRLVANYLREKWDAVDVIHL